MLKFETVFIWLFFSLWFVDVNTSNIFYSHKTWTYYKKIATVWLFSLVTFIWSVTDSQGSVGHGAVPNFVREGIMIQDLYLIIFCFEANSFLGGMTIMFASRCVCVRMSGCLSLMCLYEVRAFSSLFKWMTLCSFDFGSHTSVF